MFHTRHVLLLLVSQILLQTALFPMISAKNDDDTVGAAFGGLFKAILNVVKSQLEATKDFVPGLGTKSDEITKNDTTQTFVGHNETFPKEPSTQNNMKMGMRFGMESQKTGQDLKAEVPTSPTDSSENKTAFNEILIGQTYEGSSEEQLAIRRTDRSEPYLTTTEHTLNAGQQTEKTILETQETNQPEVSNKRIAGHGSASKSDVSQGEPNSSTTEDIPQPDVQGPISSVDQMSTGVGRDSWPYQPEVSEMMGTIEEKLDNRGISASENNRQERLEGVILNPNPFPMDILNDEPKFYEKFDLYNDSNLIQYPFTEQDKTEIHSTYSPTGQNILGSTNVEATQSTKGTEKLEDGNQDITQKAPTSLVNETTDKDNNSHVVAVSKQNNK